MSAMRTVTDFDFCPLLRAFVLALGGEPYFIVETFCSPVINSRKRIESPLIPPWRRAEVQKRSEWRYVIRGGRSAQSTSTARRTALNFWRRGSESNRRRRICSPLSGSVRSITYAIFWVAEIEFTTLRQGGLAKQVRIFFMTEILENCSDRRIVGARPKRSARSVDGQALLLRGTMICLPRHQNEAMRRMNDNFSSESPFSSTSRIRFSRKSLPNTESNCE